MRNIYVDHEKFSVDLGIKLFKAKYKTLEETERKVFADRESFEKIKERWYVLGLITQEDTISLTPEQLKIVNKYTKDENSAPVGPSRSESPLKV